MPRNSSACCRSPMPSDHFFYLSYGKFSYKRQYSKNLKYYKKIFLTINFHNSLYRLSISITVLGSYAIIHGAVSDLPCLSKAAFVASFVILLAKIGPKSSSQNVHTPVIPANISPIPPHLFLPPYKSQINDFFPNIISFRPFKTTVKLGFEKMSVIYVISYCVCIFCISSEGTSSLVYSLSVYHCN